MFNHRSIEKKWQNNWEKNNIFKTDINSKKKKYYILDMFPYPSGSGLHVGHSEGYTATDIIARMKKLQGFEVLHPMGFDAFGLPAEQYAIKTNNLPSTFTLKNINNFKEQLKMFGFAFDWSKEINTTDPAFYKYTQWIFAQLYKNGFAKLKKVEVNWSDSLNTVLSNEEIKTNEKGELVSERDELPVVKKLMEQWVLKITKYADRLFNGLQKLDWPDSVKKLQRNWIYEKDSNGKYTKKLHLRDWVFARQRYWGEPFPIIHKENGEIYLIPEQEYPIILPKLDNYSFSQDGKPALSHAANWVNYDKNGIKGIRDLNTMPQWAGSSWYFLGFILKEGNGYIPLGTKEAKRRLNKWIPVDLYIGGQEHAVLHLLYARFWTMFLKDIKVLDKEEPFNKLFNQGMILGSDGFKMSKSKGNVINPNEIIEKYGADSLRIYEMFMGPLDDDKSWNMKGIKASRAWLDRVFRFFTEKVIWDKPNDEIKREFNKMLESVEIHFNSLKFNLAISDMMIFINHLYKNSKINKKIALDFLILLSCLAPHLSEEINSKLKLEIGFLATKYWPKKINVNVKKETKVIVIQVNGKVRAEIISPKLKQSPNQKELSLFVLNHISKYVKKEQIKNIIYVKDKIINVVI